MTIIDTIKSRSSCRTFEDRPINQDLLDNMTEFIDALTAPPFNSYSKFKIIHTPDLKDKHKIGTYGFINGAQYFIIGKIKKSLNDLEDYGYLMEKIILHATALSLGTCWLGGTFTKDSALQIINSAEDETCPAISPLGYKAEKRGILERSLRKIAGSDNRIPFNELSFEESLNTPLTQEKAAQYTIPLEMLRLAPSASNKQPWRIIKESRMSTPIDKNIFHFYLCRTQRYEKTLNLINAADLQRIDMGIAMCHFELSAKEQNLNGHWEIIENYNPIDAMQYIVTWQG
ncbi:MAG: nitroreductase [Nitrospirae bacterium]|nr:nitroreductase [Nitrospirota bacterium]